jgi:excisionase family DNA binding protein
VDTGDRLLSVDDVAVLLGVPVATLYAWRYRGTGPRGLRVGRHLRYRRGDLDAWIHEQLEDSERARSSPSAGRRGHGAYS